MWQGDTGVVDLTREGSPQASLIDKIIVGIIMTYLE